MKMTIRNRRPSLEEYLHTANNFSPHRCIQEGRLVRLEMREENRTQEMSEIKNLYCSMNDKLDKGFTSINNKIIVGMGSFIGILLTALGFLVFELLTK